ncbi:MAG: hypothetical protein RR906_01430 [Acetivibrio sp.]
MEYDFLQNFTKRMKNVGAYALLFKNSIQKQTWKQYGLETIHEQTNLIFSVLLYIMEQSLREEPCTIDDIGSFIDSINMAYYKKSISYDEAKSLGEFIVNTILCDEGKAMYFEGFQYEQGKYQQISISFIGNKIIYVEGDVKRTSYYLTDDGYNLMLSTLEIESNMKLTIHEMIFKLHLEKASYDKAADDMKNIFNLLRIQLQRIQEAMGKIRQNALNYSVQEYKKLLDENMVTIDETKHKFMEYRSYVTKLVKELEQQNIHIERLKGKESDNLHNLKIIEGYLNRALDEHQKILSTHFDLKALYTKELESLSQISLIQRFPLRTELYNEVLKNAQVLRRMEGFFRPLFIQEIDKIYQLEKACAYQKPIRAREIEDSAQMVDFDNENYQKEQNEILQKKLKRYQGSISCLLGYAVEERELTLSSLKEKMRPQDKEIIFPNMEIFREIMIELIKEGAFPIEALQKEREEHFDETRKQFQISRCILDSISEKVEFKEIKEIKVARVKGGETVEFSHIQDESGRYRKINCSDVLIKII